MDSFILGVDGMVKYHQGFDSEIPFFHHELFHVYHHQHYQHTGEFWSALWQEGLATYVSEALNEGSTQKELLLNMPDNMITKINQTLDFHWSDLYKKLESRDEEDYERYFLIRDDDQDIVMRSGYYLGYLIAKEMAKTRTLYELANLEPEVLLPMIQSTIKQLKATEDPFSA